MTIHSLCPWTDVVKLHPDVESAAVLRKGIARGIGEGVFAYASGGVPKLGEDGKFQVTREKVVFSRPLAEDEVDFDSGFLLIPSAVPEAPPVPTTGTTGVAPEVPPTGPEPPIPPTGPGGRSKNSRCRDGSFEENLSGFQGFSSDSKLDEVR